MCGRLCCPFRKAPGDVYGTDDLTNILVFGVTGVTGGAVMEACTCCAWFITTGFTRATDGDCYTLLKDKDINVVSGDMENYHSVLAAMEGIDTVFLTTHYWENMSVENEFIQGYNVVNAAMQAGIRHLIYSSSDYSLNTSDDRCGYLEGKARIENYIVNSGIPSTIVHYGFLFENFFGLFKPHRTSLYEFAIAFPMGQSALNMCSVLDYGQCCAKIALRGKKYVYTTVKISAEYLTVDEIAEKFNTHFRERELPIMVKDKEVKFNFYNPKITLAEYRTLNFEAVDEFASMWGHYRNAIMWDMEPLYTMYPKHFKLCEFIKEREKVFITILTAEEEALEDSSNLSAMALLHGAAKDPVRAFKRIFNRSASSSTVDRSESFNFKYEKESNWNFHQPSIIMAPTISERKESEKSRIALNSLNSKMTIAPIVLLHKKPSVQD